MEIVMARNTKKVKKIKGLKKFKMIWGRLDIPDWRVVMKAARLKAGGNLSLYVRQAVVERAKIDTAE